MAFLSSSFRPPPLVRAKSSFSPLVIPRRFFFALLLGVLIAASAMNPTRAQMDTSKEYQIKAAFPFNCAQFVKWPPDSFANADAPFYSGSLGDDPFGATLEETIQGEAIENHKLR